jgi:hypothetical protein
MGRQEREHERRRALLALYEEFQLIYKMPAVTEPLEHEVPTVSIAAALPHLAWLPLAEEERISRAIREITLYNAAVRNLQATRTSRQTGGRELTLGSNMAKAVARQFEQDVKGWVGTAYGDLERYLQIRTFLPPRHRRFGSQRHQRRR